MAGALIIAAELGPGDFAWLEADRRRHYPSERNQVPAHLTLFRSLPPSAEAEVRRELARAAEGCAPRAVIAGVLLLDQGVAYRVVSDELDHLRSDLAQRFHGLLSSPDGGGWQPHVTIQNKVQPRVARSLAEELRHSFRSRPLAIRGLALHRYAAGPWEKMIVYPFRRVSSARPPRCS